MNILITGAGKGIGLELARLMSREHNVIAVSRNIENLTGLPENVFPIAFDITKDSFSEKLIPYILSNTGNIDVLINNAGALINKPIQSLSPDDFGSMFQTNVKAPFFLIQSLIPYFNKPAHIVNISSMGGFQGSVKFPGLSLYSASKGALAILSECLALELKVQEISVNCLCLGSVQAEMLNNAFPGYNAPVKPEAMAEFIADFSLNAWKFMNGKIIPVSLSTP
jgi:3-oxoacyl-[acyl-carrier protein] reductase